MPDETRKSYSGVDQEDEPSGADSLLGLVDGSVPSSTRRFHVVLTEGAVVQLDDIVTTSQTLADGRVLRHFGIVVEGTGQIEGAELPSDTHRISSARTMPGVTSRRVEVQTLRTSWPQGNLSAEKKAFSLGILRRTPKEMNTPMSPRTGRTKFFVRAI